MLPDYPAPDMVARTQSGAGAGAVGPVAVVGAEIVPGAAVAVRHKRNYAPP